MPELKLRWWYKNDRAEDTWDCLDQKQAFERAVLIGRELRSRRESQGWSLAHVSDVTRISVSALDAIEKGELYLLPGNDGKYWSLNVYVKNFIRTYAESLNFTEDPLLLYSAAAAPAISVATNEPSLETRAGKSVPARRPPKFAEYLLYLFLTKSERINLIGDLSEEYLEVSAKFGHRQANLWFYKQVCDSLKPLIWRSVSKLRLLASIVELLSRLTNRW